jgi:hypothetical protein
VLFIVTFVLFRIEVSNGRASRLSKSAHSQLRMEEEAARIRPLNHGHHRTAKQPRRELPSTVEATPSQKNRNSSLEKAPPRTKGGDESPQDGVTVLATYQPACYVPSEHRQTR